MKENVKKIIACTLTITAFTSTGIIDCNEKFVSTIAYADTATKNSVLLDGIELSEGEDINFSPDIKSYTVRVKQTISHIDVKVSPQGDDKKIKVSINDNLVDDDDDYKLKVDLKKGENLITVKIQNKKDETKIETYTINVIRSMNGKADENLPDDIYINYLCVGTEEIDLDKDILKYTVNVDESVSKTCIKIEPEYDDYEVKINGDELKKRSRYKYDVDLKEGENIVKIKLKDDDKTRTYTIMINRGKAETSNTNAATGSSGNNVSDMVIQSSNVDNNSSTQDNIDKLDQWVQVDGKWQYNDLKGKPVKNVWIYDKNVSKYYFLQSDGFRATGWINNDNNWYLLDNNGEMQTGWRFVDGSWYLLDTTGAMKIGWFQANDGSWYYLDSDGKMKTGWLQNSTGDYYYLDSEGKMKTGWLEENGSWYYLNIDGRMETSSAVVDGHTYYFKSNGELK